MTELNNYLFDPESKPKDQETIISIHGKIFNFRGSLSIISGLPKARKTTLNLGIFFSMLCDKEIFGFKSKQMSNLIYIDTEQTEADMFRNYQYCKKITGCNPDINKAKIFLFRTLEPEEILLRINEIILTHKPQVIFIDSLTDLVNNINDILECKHVLNMIKNITSINNLSCIALLHNSKNNHNYTLGHLGSGADRTAQSVIAVRKCSTDKNSTIIESKLLRSDADFDSYRVTFNADSYELSDETGSVQKKPLTPADINFSTHIDLVKKSFEFTDKGGLQYADLFNALKNNYQKGNNWIKAQLIPFLVDQNYLDKKDRKYYLYHSTDKINMSAKGYSINKTIFN
jgi:hypothetical protein